MRTKGSASEFVSSEDVLNAGQAVVAMRAPCNKCKHISTPSKERGERSAACKWSDNSDSGERCGCFGVFQKAPPRHRPGPREPSAQVEAWAKDVRQGWRKW